ncbi:hypothetical protein ACJRO7_007580 [Eucalyptus globulus]|uniref:Uncharacterized protein n=1 Tax=Eucalyptus globulus TaxID=34317 RepID=A0ABD3INV3_EUCGL
MVGPISNLGSLHSPPIFSSKMPSPSTSIAIKLKTLIQTLIFSRACRVSRALSKAKSFLADVIRKGPPVYFIYFAKNKRKSKMYIGSFRMYYNWCSSRSYSTPTSVLDGFRTNHLYYDSTWNCSIPTSEAPAAECEDEGESQLSGYLQWLEEKNKAKASGSFAELNNANEIDELADVFIAQCHEKFILEKQESDRRFQEMLARGI